MGGDGEEGSEGGKEMGGKERTCRINVKLLPTRILYPIYRMVPIKTISDRSLGFKGHDIFEVEYLKNRAFYGQSYSSNVHSCGWFSRSLSIDKQDGKSVIGAIGNSSADTGRYWLIVIIGSQCQG